MKPLPLSPIDSLDVFLTAQKVAVVGASETGLYPAGIIQNLITKGYPGKIYPVNPNRSTVFDLPCYPSLSDLPESVDLVIFVLRRDLVYASLEECARLGIKAVLIISAGFAEQDELGKTLQEKIRLLAEANGIRVLGPNCAGYAAIPERLIATRLPVLPRSGDVSFISGSGALMMALLGLFVDRGIGLNRLVSVGNQMDISLGEWVGFFARDCSTRLIAAFIEGVQDAGVLVDGFRTALTSGKPLVVVKSGRTSSGQLAAATHTAAVAGSDKVFESVCRQFGVILAEDVQAMMDILQLHTAFGDRLKPVKHLMVVTQSGGMGSLTADLLENNGLTLAPVSEGLLQSIQGQPHLKSISSWGNPADVRGTNLRQGLTAATLDPFLIDPQNDLVLLLLARTLIHEADLETARGIITAAQTSDKPLVVVWVGQRIPAEDQPVETAETLLKQAGIPVFDQSSTAVKALGQLVRYWTYREDYLTHSGEVE